MKHMEESFVKSITNSLCDSKVKWAMLNECRPYRPTDSLIKPIFLLKFRDHTLTRRPTVSQFYGKSTANPWWKKICEFKTQCIVLTVFGCVARNKLCLFYAICCFFLQKKRQQRQQATKCSNYSHDKLKNAKCMEYFSIWQFIWFRRLWQFSECQLRHILYHNSFESMSK